MCPDVHLGKKMELTPRRVLIRALTLEIKTLVNKGIEQSLKLHAYFLHFE